ncbi:MAG TPA: class I SAM-dependent methyltransferase [Candidatus Saccharimonadales bacterium]|nr:class I SAM-dependent methyltransferase [Candidatus Saccharimonadales bacterium]
MSTASQSAKKADQYNDPSHNYLKYWNGRDYENDAEVLAIKRLLKGRHFKVTVDVGGGYGRLDPLLAEFSDEVTLAEPSQQQLDIAKDFLKDSPSIKRRLMQADNLQFKDGEVNLLAMIRVLHHLPDPSAEFAEISRVLSPDGYAIIEVANYAHAENRLKHLLKGKKMPTEPVDIRSPEHRGKDEIAFVNHNPHTVIKQLADAGLSIERMLSVSNLRSQSIKKVMPKRVMLSIEDFLQPILAKTFFGPSVFFFAKKAK